MRSVLKWLTILVSAILTFLLLLSVTPSTQQAPLVATIVPPASVLPVVSAETVQPSRMIQPLASERIVIKRLGIDLPLAEGDMTRDVEQAATPEGAAFHLPGTALPGEVGNSYIYAHARAGMFLSLWQAAIGDEVDVSGPAQTLRYEVVSVLPRVAPDDMSVIAPTPFERLTLQTSTGPNGSYPRFVVIALRRN